MTATSEQRCLIHSTMGDCPFCRIDEANARADALAARLQRIAAIVEAVDARRSELKACDEITMAELSEIYQLATLDRPVVDPLLEEARKFTLLIARLVTDEGLSDVALAGLKGVASKLDEALKERKSNV